MPKSQEQIDARRRYVKCLIDAGIQIDYSAIGKKFGCSRTAIMSDIRVISKSGGVGISLIYTLNDKTGVRYIGQATNVFDRIKDHINKAKNGDKTKKSMWILSLLERGEEPELFVIDECDRESATEREIYWIGYYLSLGCDLVNTYLLSDASRKNGLKGGRPRKNK